MALTNTALRNAKPSDKPQKLSDGHGLYLYIASTGGRLWRMNYRFDGRQKTLSFGPYPLVTLAEARQKRDVARRQLLDGHDPGAIRKDEKRKAKLARQNTFGIVAEEYLNKIAQEGRAPVTIKKNRWVLDFARRDLWDRTIHEITSVDVLDCLRGLEARGTHETARRLRSTISSVCRYAIATGRLTTDPTTALKGALIAPTVTSHAAITDAADFAKLLCIIDAYGGQPATKAGLQLMALLYPRPGELRQAEWHEFDLDAATWTIPPERMKGRKPHRKPLSRQAIDILRGLKRVTGNYPLAFPGTRTWKRPVSENTFNNALRRMGYPKEVASAHGFRASASTLLNESGKWQEDAIERELSHVESNEVRRAYARGEHWDERVLMAQWWADHLDQLKYGAMKAGGKSIE
jgi:integrase